MMAKKVNAESTQKFEKRLFDTIVVGAGPAGILCATQCAESGKSVLLLEAAEVAGGSAKTGFSLVDSEEALNFPILTGSILEPIQIRWERQWVSPSEVDWNSKEWEAPLPQWQSMLDRVLSYFIDMATAPHCGITTEFRLPVIGLRFEDSLWIVVTPEGDFQASEIHWSAGIMAFQNAIGKLESQRFLVENPKYQMAAADYRGGMGIDWELSAEDAANFTVAPYRLFGLPVRFEGKLMLLIGALVSNEAGLILRTFVHLHHERLKDPKTLSAIQKSIRRGLNSLFGEDQAPKNPKERSYVHDRILGHIEGTPWVLHAREDSPRLNFIGEESALAARAQCFDIPAALHSVV